MNVVCLDTVAFLKENKKTFFFSKSKENVSYIACFSLFKVFIYLFFLCMEETGDIAEAV